MKTQITISILTFIMLLAFQNCGNQYAAASYKISQSRGNAMDPNKVQVGPSVWPRMDSTIANPVPLSVSQQALPIAIDFGVNPNFQEHEAQFSWGTWLNNWRQWPVESHIFLGQPRYQYRLDLFKNSITDLTQGTVVYKLSKKEVKLITTIMTESILAKAGVRNSDCGEVGSQEYATLETDYGLFDLGSGTACAMIDLFNTDGSGKLAGLETLLAALESKAN